MQELWEGDMALTVAKSLPAGLHLYNTITGETLEYKVTQEGRRRFANFVTTFRLCFSLQMIVSPCTVQAFIQTLTCLCGTAER